MRSYHAYLIDRYIYRLLVTESEERLAFLAKSAVSDNLRHHASLVLNAHRPSLALALAK